MKLQEALTDISALRYYAICGYSYRSLKHYNHSELTYQELPKDFQDGVLVLIRALYRTQKMVYVYDIDFVNRCIADCGIKLVPFYRSCGLDPTFHRTLSLSKNREERLTLIRLRLIIIINRLLEYVTDS